MSLRRIVVVGQLSAFPDSLESNGYPDTHSRVAPLLPVPDSDSCRTPFRAIPDTVPILSDTIPMVPENSPTSARNTVRHESERCPAEIAMLSDRNWNQCPTAVGIRTKAWLTEQRQFDAVKMICDGASIKAAASSLGYKHSPNFSRSFKSRFGTCLGEQSPTFNANELPNALK